MAETARSINRCWWKVIQNFGNLRGNNLKKVVIYSVIWDEMPSIENILIFNPNESKNDWIFSSNNICACMLTCGTCARTHTHQREIHKSQFLFLWKGFGWTFGKVLETSRKMLEVGCCSSRFKWQVFDKFRTNFELRAELKNTIVGCSCILT